MISTGLKKIDDFLSGGIPNGVIVDIFGGNGTGKTQLLLQLSINSIKNGGKVLFLDTTGGFRPERILEIQKKSNSNLNLLNNIIVSRITNTSEQINSIKNFKENNFSLIIIDNIWGQGSDATLVNASVSIGIVFVALIILVMLGTLIGLIPAFKATSIKPIEALREE